MCRRLTKFLLVVALAGVGVTACSSGTNGTGVGGVGGHATGGGAGTTSSGGAGGASGGGTGGSPAGGSGGSGAGGAAAVNAAILNAPTSGGITPTRTVPTVVYPTCQ
jgi:hypothetical protein